MARIFQRSATGLLRSRWGLALIIAVVVLAAVTLGRIFSDGDPGTPTAGPGTARPSISFDPHDDGVGTPPPPPSPRTSPGTAKPEAVAYAFASAWVDHRGVSARQWYDRLLPHSTPGLAERLAGVDPATVPADRILDRPTLIPHAERLVEAQLAVDSGQLRLRLVAPDGKWLVDGVDWDRS